MREDSPQLPVRTLEVGDGAARRRIAYIARPPATERGLGIVWLIGLKSDMVSTKAVALDQFCAEQSYGLLRFDYSGHGQSEGRFEDAVLGDWIEETRAVFTNLTRGPQIVIGSSTGGQVALSLLQALLETDPAEACRIKALILIAPAWDLTEELMWKQFPEAARRELMEMGVYHQPSEYGEPYPITRRFIEEGRNHLLLGKNFDPQRPVFVLQGAQDTAVPIDHARRLQDVLSGGWVDIIEVPDGEHRLSRPEDLERLFSLVQAAAAMADTARS